MQTLYNIKKMLWDELDEYANKKELSAGDLEAVHKLTDTIKNICKIDRMTSEMGGTSHDGGMWDAHGSYDMGGNSMRRDGRMDGRSHTDGHSMDGYSGRNRHYVRGHYSYDGDHKKRLYHELGEASEYATTDRERQILNEAMRKLENA